MEQARKVLIGPSSFASVSTEPMNRLIQAGFQVIENPYKRKLSKGELLNLLSSDVSGIIAGLETLDSDVFSRTSLRVVSRCGSGLSNVDLKAAEEWGIIVRNTPLAPVTAVTELTIGCLLSLLRHVPAMDRDLHKRQWVKRIGRQLKGMQVAVIGFGNIGRMTAQLLQAFGSRVIAVDPAYTGKVRGVDIMDLHEALALADALILHSSGERQLLGEKEFLLMKKGIYILNAARGGLIDEVALRHALDSGRVAAAWLDTFTEEPYNGDLCDYAQVIVTPHIGSYTVECRRDMEMEAVENLIEAFKDI